MSKVEATVKFLIDNDAADKFKEVVATSYCWINEDWFEKHYPELWHKVHIIAVNDVIVENF